ncbi:hypothetical protein L2E82_40739 [Cichorium intybus]|uniref:Uncharacterized protein n=1 Tax=Cichorium intybus TaxID=13427 RepID=A0ACB9AL98_CICIN|nr:hypothetical protein L2E82_40739 [Cichorium intybus]
MKGTPHANYDTLQMHHNITICAVRVAAGGGSHFSISSSFYIPDFTLFVLPPIHSTIFIITFLSFYHIRENYIRDRRI